MSAVPLNSARVVATAAPFGGPGDLVRDRIVHFETALELKSGRMLDDWRLAYRLVGNPRLPMVLVMGGISAGRQFWNQPDTDPDGWWQHHFGPGHAGDFDRFCFLAIDFLGGNGESTGPDNWAGSASAFPAVDTLDQATVIRALLDRIGVVHLQSVVGASYGGMVALQLAARYPDSLKRALIFCAADRPSPLASGWRHVQRQVLEFGIAAGKTREAVRIARALAMCTYRSEREFSRRFAFNQTGIGSLADYLDHCGDRFSEQFGVYSYRCLSQSIDDHVVDPAAIGCRVDLVGFTTDQIVPPQQLIELRRRLSGDGSLRLLDTPYGHDAFLTEKGVVGPIIRKHLESRS